MKRRISIILISAILIQLAGCYSSYYITADDLTSLEGDEEIKITTLSKEEYLTKEWKILNDTLQVATLREIVNTSDNETKKFYEQSGKMLEKKYTLLPLSSIKEIYYEELESTNTIVLTTFICGALFVTGYLLLFPHVTF